MKKFRPILFSTEMVQAILEGRKTQTRRIVKPQPMLQGRTDDRVLIYNRNNNVWEVKDKLSSDGFSILSFFKSKYSIGDILWVRETTCFVLSSHTDLLEGMSTQTIYKASVHPDWMEYAKEKYGYKWTPSIHMEKYACRIFLRVKNVRVERVQEIIPNDILDEGLGIPQFTESHELFALWKNTWNKINGQESWDSNPWVWVIKFERIQLTERE